MYIKNKHIKIMNLYKSHLSLYSFLCVVTILITVTAFFFLKKDWIAYQAGENLFFKKEFKHSILEYLEAYNQGMRQPKLYQRLGDANTAIGNFQEAIKWYRLFLSQKPHDSKVRLSLARVLSYVENYDESVKEYKQAMEDDHEKNFTIDK